MAAESLAVHGRVPFFFMAHVALLALLGLVLPRVPLPATYSLWVGFLAAFWWPCRAYFRMKRERPNLVTRYI